MTDTTQGGRWQVDRKIPLALIIMIFLQTAGAFWWASSLTARVETLEKQMAAAAPQRDRLTRVEVRLDNVVDGIGEIKALLRPTPPRQ
jgi:hypothetical protein